MTWGICDVRAESVYVGLVAVPGKNVSYSGKDIADSFHGELAMLEKDVRPPGWADDPLRLTKDFASLSENRRTVVGSPNKSVKLTPQLVVNAGKLLESPVQSPGGQSKAF